MGLLFHYNLRWQETGPSWTLSFRQALHYELEDAANFYDGAIILQIMSRRFSWPSKPRYQLQLDSPGQIHVQLKGPKQYQIGFDLLTVSASDKNSPQYFTKKSSGLYRSGFTVFTVEAVAGTYDIVPSTFSPAQEGPFFLLVASNSSFKLTKTR